MSWALERVKAAGAVVMAAALVLTLAATEPVTAQVAVHTTDFSDGEPGEPPPEWTSVWDDGYFAVQEEPSRLTQNAAGAVRQLLSYDAPGEINGEVEVAGLVHVPADNQATRAFQVHVSASGESGNETSYYLEVRRAGGGELRLGRFAEGYDANELATAAIDDTFADYQWLNVVIARDGADLQAKVWPHGESEPEEWDIEFTDDAPISETGYVGIGNTSPGATPAWNDWAWFAVGSGGLEAPRADPDLVDIPSEPDQVTGVGLDHDHVYTTVSWDPDDDAAGLSTRYEIQRTQVDEQDQPIGDPLLVGVWHPNRYTYTDTQPTFADAGFLPGERYGWRVRAVAGGEAGEWSQWRTGETVRSPSPDEHLTGFEERIHAEDEEPEWTTYEEEIDFTYAVEDASDRVRVELAGRTHQGRDINLFVIGDPPQDNPQGEDPEPSVLLNCNVHGNEPSGREACLAMVRDLAFSDEDWVADLLAETDVLVVPAINGDGRAANTRGNARGNTDLNRDHSLLEEPETAALAGVLRDYRPQTAIDGHHYGNNHTGDLPLLWPRNPNVNETLYDVNKNDLTFDHLFSRAADTGWWPAPYPIGYAQETILRNTFGLKQVVGVLLESRSQAGPTRPGEEDDTTANRRRHYASQLWTYRQMLDYQLENHEGLSDLIADAEELNEANTEPVYFDGARTTPRHEPPDEPTTQVMDPAPCGYVMSDYEFTVAEDHEEFGTIPSVQDRVQAHGIHAEEVDGDWFIPAGQRLRPLVPLLFDEDAAEPMRAVERVMDDCPDVEPDPDPDPDPDPTPTEEPSPEPTPEPSPDPIEDEEPELTVHRMAGTGRVETTIEVSQAEFADQSADTVVLARADDYADALAGTPLATANNGPLLVTSSDALLDNVAEEIQRVMVPGGTVRILGGESAISADVEDELLGQRLDVERIGGDSRIETSLEVLRHLDEPSNLLLTTAYDYADALTAGAAAAAQGGAVVLTTPDEPHELVDGVLDDVDTDRYAIGGPAARAYPDLPELSGETRDATAVAVAEEFFPDASAVGIARRDDFPDALAGGVYLARHDAPLLLTDPNTLADEAAEYLEPRIGDMTLVTLFGGESAVSEDVADHILELRDDQ